MVICVKFHHDRTSALQKSNLTRNFNLSGMEEQTNEWIDERTSRSQPQTFFLNSDMLLVICVKFHHHRTSASQKSNLTKNFNLSGMDEQTDKRLDKRTVTTSN